MTDELRQTTIAIIEDTPVFLDYFSSIVEASPEFRLAGTATTGQEGMQLIDQQPAQMYLVDLGLPDMSGIELIRHARQRHPDSEVMVITMFGDEQSVVSSIEAGATGYLLKDSSEQEFRDALRAMCAGGSPVSPAVARKLLQRFSELGSTGRQTTEASPAAAESTSTTAPSGIAGTPDDTGELPLLTQREVQILKLLAMGMTFGEISDSLSISSHTVAKHVKNIYRKLAVNSRGEAVYVASKFGIIDL